MSSRPDTLGSVTDATIVGDDPVLDSLGAFLAASLIPEAPAPEPTPAPAPRPVTPRNLLRPWPDADPAEAPAPIRSSEPVRLEFVDAFLPEPAKPTRPVEPRVVTADAGTVTGDADDSDTDDVVRPPSKVRTTVEWLAIVLGAVLVAVVIRVAVIQSFVIPSPSMYPTLHDNDRVLVNRLAYEAHDIRRGDVIVFDRPKTSVLPPGTPAHLIKRVIGLPGDTLVARAGVVYVDGRRLREPYLAPGTLTQNLDTAITIPAGHVFVMGDNRMDSTDSRSFGPISVKSVVGRAFARIWPPSRIGFL